MAGKFVIAYQAGKGYHFNLLASNGQVIATSEHYETRRSCEEGIESVKRNAPDAPVEDQT